jgi:hypothetical protein
MMMASRAGRRPRAQARVVTRTLRRRSPPPLPPLLLLPRCHHRRRRPPAPRPPRPGRRGLRPEKATANRAGSSRRGPEAAGARLFRPKPRRPMRGRPRPPRRPPRCVRRDRRRIRRLEKTAASRAGMPRPEAAGAGHARAVTAAPHRPMRGRPRLPPPRRRQTLPRPPR